MSCVKAPQSEFHLLSPCSSTVKNGPPKKKSKRDHQNEEIINIEKQLAESVAALGNDIENRIDKRNEKCKSFSRTNS